MKRFRVQGLVIFREGVSTLNIHSTLWEPLDFIHFMCYNLLALEDGVKERVVIKRRRGLFLFTFIIDLEGLGHLPTLPVRDQNLVVRGRNCCLICFCVFY